MFKAIATYRSRNLIVGIPVLLFLYVIFAKPLVLYYLCQYTKLIVREILIDRTRLLENDIQLAQKEWRLYQMESKFGQKWCQEKVKPRSDWTWLTAMVNDDFAVPALVLGYSLQKFSCQKNMIALVSSDVSQGARNALGKVGWSIREVERLDCDWIEKQKGLPQLHSGYIGTHTRFHAWNYTEFSKIIYADPDYMPMTNIDDLFDVKGDFAAATCSRPGVLDPCFNAGLLVFRPDAKDYKGIMDLWWTTTDDHCPNDQVLLWHYYADAGRWTALPYSYNVRRITFRPMKAYHFACCIPPKPWSARCRPSRVETEQYDQPITKVERTAIVFWKNLYELLKVHDLDEWWMSTRFYRKNQEFGNLTSEQCWKLPGYSDSEL